MTAKNNGWSSAARVERGAATLAAAEFVDVGLIRDRLDAFSEAHRIYAEAHRAVGAAEAALRAGQETLLAREEEQDAAIEALACALANDRESRLNPFAAFGMPTPSRINHMGVAEAAKVIHELVAAVQRNTATIDATRQAALAAESAAQAVETELAPLQKLRANVRTTRAARTAAAGPWNQSLAILKRCARAAADQGAPALYEALFGPPNRVKKKPQATEPVPVPATEAAPAPAGEVKSAATQ